MYAVLNNLLLRIGYLLYDAHTVGRYSLIGNRPNDLVRLDIRINGEDAAPLASICHKENAHPLGKGMTEKLKELIPRQQIPVKIQACIGVKPVASSVISPLRKDVLAKCYGKHVLDQI
jgi:translation elongation factor EF-4